MQKMRKRWGSSICLFLLLYVFCSSASSCKREEFQIWMQFSSFSICIAQRLHVSNGQGLSLLEIPSLEFANTTLPFVALEIYLYQTGFLGTSLLGMSPTSCLLLLALACRPKQINEAFHLSAHYILLNCNQLAQLRGTVFKSHTSGCIVIVRRQVPTIYWYFISLLNFVSWRSINKQMRNVGCRSRKDGLLCLWSGCLFCQQASSHSGAMLATGTL